VSTTAASVPSSPRDAAGTLTGGVAVWANLASVYVIWGSTYLAIRVLVRTVPPLLGAGSRFMVAGLAMLAFLGPRRALRVGWRELAACALVGTLLAAGGNGLVTVAERHVPSGFGRRADRVGAAVDRRLPCRGA
jgi:drug/metabolite transporter (DMT)-like permease